MTWKIHSLIFGECFEMWPADFCCRLQRQGSAILVILMQVNSFEEFFEGPHNLYAGVKLRQTSNKSMDAIVWTFDNLFIYKIIVLFLLFLFFLFFGMADRHQRDNRIDCEREREGERNGMWKFCIPITRPTEATCCHTRMTQIMLRIFHTCWRVPASSTLDRCCNTVNLGNIHSLPLSDTLNQSSVYLSFPVLDLSLTTFDYNNNNNNHMIKLWDQFFWWL